MKTVDIKGFEQYYTISDNGDVFSRRKGRLMKKTQRTRTGYVKGFLTGDNKRRWYGVHQLVLTHFVSECPPGMETHHRDHNKENNHVSNLEWTTHSENILRSFRDNNRHSWWLGRKRGKFDEEHRRKMALAKHKPATADNGAEVLRFDSVGEFLNSFGTYRKNFNRCVGTDKEIGGYKIKFV